MEESDSEISWSDRKVGESWRSANPGEASVVPGLVGTGHLESPDGDFTAELDQMRIPDPKQAQKQQGWLGRDSKVEDFGDGGVKRNGRKRELRKSGSQGLG